MNYSFNKIEKVKGTLELPGDKSISHRSVMFASLAKGKSIIHNLSNAEDVNSTRKCFVQLGCNIETEKDVVVVEGKGFKGFTQPATVLDAGNSGTTSRLISGILIAQDFETTIIGDASLSSRPMKRIIDPLSLMGGVLKTTEKFTLPMTISPSPKLNPIEYCLPVPSAQIKSSVLLAGLHLDEQTTVLESIPSRNHTELMLNLNVENSGEGKKVFVSRNNYPSPGEYFVPSDISTASFFIILALLAKDSELRIKNVSLNETRTGIIEVLRLMGGRIEIDNQQRKMGELFGDLVIFSSKLKNVEISETLIPNIIDEIPVLSVAGIFADGDFRIAGAKELRFKETDRISAICRNMKSLGLSVEEFEDGFNLSGEIRKGSPVFESFNDHRIAMSTAILSCLLNSGGSINDFECVSISNPNFINQLQSIAR